MAEMWNQLSPTNTPPARSGASLTFHQGLGKAILFGGLVGEKPRNDTWIWDDGSGTWTETTKSAQPPARHSAAAAYSPKAGAIFIHGGVNERGRLLRDTWVLRDLTSGWEQVADGDPSRAEHAMAYHAAGDTLVLAGGRSDTNYHDDSWAWNAETSAWTQLENPGQTFPKRGYHAMAYDGRGSLILFGGVAPDGTYFSDSWMWSPVGSWVTGSFPGPGGRAGHTLAQSVGGVYLFGGTGVSGKLRDTWKWDPQQKKWGAVPVANVPPRRSLHAAAGLSSGGATKPNVLLYGGAGASLLADTWRLTEESRRREQPRKGDGHRSGKY